MITNRQEIIDKLIDEHDCKYSEEFVDWLLNEINSCDGCEYEKCAASNYCKFCIRGVYTVDNYEKEINK